MLFRSTFRLPANVPAGSAGTHRFTAHVEARAGDASVSWPVTIDVGRGQVRDWLVVGPDDPAPTANPEWVSTRPGGWNWEKPMALANGNARWQRVARTPSLEFSSLFPRPEGNPRVARAAYAIATLDSMAETWVELVAGLGGPGSRHELQFYLDGRELQDLRLGRETWSPKRLPFFMGKGRHVILVVARSRDHLPGVTFSVRELDDHGGGRVRPVAPWQGE